MTINALESFVFMRDVLAGIAMLAIVLAFHGFCVSRVAFQYELNCRLNLARHRPHRVTIQFYLAIMVLALVHIVEVLFWAAALTVGGLVKSFGQAVLFSGSCYTTVGFMDNLLPDGWKFVAIIITLSGLFSMAWSTSLMISMMDHFRQAWIETHERLVQMIVDEEHHNGK